MPEYVHLVKQILAAAEAKYAQALDEIDDAVQRVGASALLQASETGSAVRLG